MANFRDFHSMLVGGSKSGSSSTQSIFKPQKDFLTNQFLPELTSLFQQGAPVSQNELAGRESALTAAGQLPSQFVDPAQGAIQQLFAQPGLRDNLVTDAVSGAISPLFEQFQNVIAPEIRRSSGGAGQPGGSRGTIATRLAANDLFNTAGNIGSQIALNAELGARGQDIGALQGGLGAIPGIAGLSLLPSDIQRQIGAEESGQDLNFLAQIKELLGQPTVLGSSQSTQSQQRGATQGFQDVFGGGGGGGGAASGLASMFSDRRLKRNIQKIGKLANGLNIYKYTYIWGVAAIGVMADEVKKLIPDAVTTHKSGFDMVDYSRI